MFSTLKALPRTVWLIGLISLVNDSASEMLYPIMPLYLTSVLMAGPRALGIIEGIAEATSSLFKLVSGVIDTTTNRRVKRHLVTTTSRQHGSLPETKPDSTIPMDK